MNGEVLVKGSLRAVCIRTISDLKEELRKTKYQLEIAKGLNLEYEKRENELQAEVKKNYQQLSEEEEKNMTLAKQLVEEQSRIRTLEKRIKEMEQKAGKNLEDSENVKKLQHEVHQLKGDMKECRVKHFSLERNFQMTEKRLSEYKESSDVYEERISRMEKEMRRLANANASFIGYDPRSQSQEPITPQMTSATSQSLMMGSTTEDKTPATVGQAAMKDSGSSDGGNSSQSRNASISSQGGVGHDGSSSQSGYAGISSGSSSRGGIVEHFHMCLLEGKKNELEKEVKALKSKVKELEARNQADTERDKSLQELKQKLASLKSRQTNES